MSERDQTDGNPGGRRDDALRAAPLRIASRQARRAAAVFRELTDPLPMRLSERDRVAIERLCARLFRDAEDEMRASIVAGGDFTPDDGFAAALGAAHVAIAGPILERAGLWPDPQIVAIAFDRNAMHEAGRRLRGEVGPDDTLGAMLGEGGQQPAADAMAYLIAESRANLRFDEPQLPLADLPERPMSDLVWRIAAALRDYGVARHGLDADRLDQTIVAAAESMLSSIGEESGLGEAATSLAMALHSSGKVDETFLRSCCEDGRLPLYAALLGRYGDIDSDAAWTLIRDEDGVGHALLLRASEVGRDVGGSLVMTMRDAIGGADVAGRGADQWLSVWDTLETDQARDALAHWRTDPAYRDALASISRESDRR